MLFLPLSGIQPKIVRAWDSDPAQRETFATYLDGFVAPSKLEGRRKVVAIDLAATRMGLLTAHALLRRYYDRTDIASEVAVSMLALNTGDRTTRPLYGEGTEPDPDDSADANPVFEQTLVPGMTGSRNQEAFLTAILDKTFKEELLFVMWARLNADQVLAGKQPHRATGEFARMLRELFRLPALIRELDDL